MSDVTTVGIALAKNVFAVPGVDGEGGGAAPQRRPRQLLELIFVAPYRKRDKNDGERTDH